MNKRFVSLSILVSTLIPSNALAGLFESADWLEHSYYAAVSEGIGAPGIGGVEVKIQNNLELSSSDLSYDDGYLIADLGTDILSIPVSSIELREIVELVGDNDELTLQASLDSTPFGPYPYLSPSLRDTLFIGPLFLMADLEFAALAQGRLPMPPNGTIHPYIEAIDLLQSSGPYSEIPTRWPESPTDWPQLYMTFSPETTGLISMEFQPQLLFRNSAGYPVYVDNEIADISMQPYIPLIEDVNNRPEIYREVLPTVDRAANIATVLGLVDAACPQPVNCQHLLIESTAAEFSTLLQEYETLEDYQEVSSENYSENRSQLSLLWDLLSFADFEPGQNPQAWGRAYDGVQEHIQYLTLAAVESATSELPEDESYRYLASYTLGLAQDQFLEYTTPEDALLQAAAAVVFVWQGEEGTQRAIQNLKQALELSANSPGTRAEVARMGLFVGTVLSSGIDQQKGEAILTSMNEVYDEALIASYDEVDLYLAGCMETISNCSSSDLRIWEADAARAGLNREIEGKDIAWLQGRFAYLVGVQEPAFRADRLRFLEAYAQLATSELHQRQLLELAADLESMLEGE
ncbi:MAG: hypothetical protein ACFBSF_20140 [Leptolyngbyaceae cyanobacterium]